MFGVVESKLRLVLLFLNAGMYSNVCSFNLLFVCHQYGLFYEKMQRTPSFSVMVNKSRSIRGKKNLLGISEKW